MTNAPDLQATYETYFAQFQGQHTGIASYYCTSTESVIAASRSEDKFKYPLLHSDLPTISIKGNRENIIAWFQAPLFILIQPTSGEIVDVDQAFAKARKIANHIVLKLLADHISKDGDAAALEFPIDSVHMEPVRSLWSDNAVGYELNLKVGFYMSTCLNDD
jgi:hypothetical protein